MIIAPYGPMSLSIDVIQWWVLTVAKNERAMNRKKKREALERLLTEKVTKGLDRVTSEKDNIFASEPKARAFLDKLKLSPSFA